MIGRKRAEEALRASEARYKALREDNPFVYFTPDEQGMVISVNSCGRNIHREQEYEARQAIARLTAREREVLQALADGLDGREIAERLGISIPIERNHVSAPSPSWGCIRSCMRWPSPCATTWCRYVEHRCWRRSTTTTL